MVWLGVCIGVRWFGLWSLCWWKMVWFGVGVRWFGVGVCVIWFGLVFVSDSLVLVFVLV